MKCLDINNTDLQSINFADERNINGGLLLIGSVLGYIAAGLIIAAGAEIMDDWDNFEKGFKGEPYQP